MYVYDKPYFFSDDDALDVKDLNYIWKYKQEALADAASKRFVEGVIPLRFMRSASNAYDTSDSVEIRTFKFTPPKDMYVTRAFMQCVFSSAVTSDVEFKFLDGFGSVPAGCTTPWLVAPAGSNGETTDSSPARFKLNAGEDYSIYVDSASSFNATKIDIVVNVVYDRFEFYTGNEPYFDPSLFQETDWGSIRLISNANRDDFELTQVPKLLQQSCLPVTYCMHDVSLTTAYKKLFPIPMFDDSRAVGSIKAVSLYAAMDTAAPFDLLAQIVDSSGTVYLSQSFNFTIFTSRYSHGTYSIDIDAAISGVSANSTNDFFFQFKVSSGTVTVNKIFAVCWIG